MRNLLLQIAGALAEEGKSLGEISEFMRRNVLRCQFIFRSEHDKLVSRKKSDFFANQFLAPGHPRVGALLLRPAREEGAALPADGYATTESFVLYVLAEFFFAFSKMGRWRSAWASTARPGSGKIVVYSDKKNRATNAKMSMSGNSGG